MRTAYRLLLLVVLFAVPLRPQDQPGQKSADKFSEFLTRYQKNLDRVGEAYSDLVSENLPLRDETGQPVGRHHLDDRRKELADLRQMVRELAENRQDLVRTIRLFIQTEALVDDIFDLSQIAYDNDYEELGKRFSDLETATDQDREFLESYALGLAAEKQQRILELEKQNSDLEKKLKEDAERPKAKSRRH